MYVVNVLLRIKGKVGLKSDVSWIYMRSLYFLSVLSTILLFQCTYLGTTALARMFVGKQDEKRKREAKRQRELKKVHIGGWKASVRQTFMIWLKTPWFWRRHQSLSSKPLCRNQLTLFVKWLDNWDVRAFLLWLPARDMKDLRDPTGLRCTVTSCSCHTICLTLWLVFILDMWIRLYIVYINTKMKKTFFSAIINHNERVRIVSLRSRKMAEFQLCVLIVHSKRVKSVWSSRQKYIISLSRLTIQLSRRTLREGEMFCTDSCNSSLHELQYASW